MKNNIYQIIKEELEGIYQSQEDSNPTLPDFGDRIRSIDEDFKNNTIYAYHATSCDSIEGIELNGIKAGNRSMQGKGTGGERNECQRTGQQRGCAGYRSGGDSTPRRGRKMFSDGQSW